MRVCLRPIRAYAPVGIIVVNFRGMRGSVGFFYSNLAQLFRNSFNGSTGSKSLFAIDTRSHLFHGSGSRGYALICTFIVVKAGAKHRK